MKKRILFVAFVICGWFSNKALAQKAAFSADSVKFLKEAIEFIGEDRKTAKDFKESFVPVWLNEYKYSQRIQVYRLANKMAGTVTGPIQIFTISSGPCRGLSKQSSQNRVLRPGLVCLRNNCKAATVNYCPNF